MENSLVEKILEPKAEGVASAKSLYMVKSKWKIRLEFLNSLRQGRLYLARSLFVVTGLLLASVIWSLASMAWTQSKPVGWVSGPIAFLFLGVTFSAVFISSWQTSRLELPELETVE